MGESCESCKCKVSETAHTVDYYIFYRCDMVHDIIRGEISFAPHASLPRLLRATKVSHVFPSVSSTALSASRWPQLDSAKKRDIETLVMQNTFCFEKKKETKIHSDDVCRLELGEHLLLWGWRRSKKSSPHHLPHRHCTRSRPTARRGRNAKKCYKVRARSLSFPTPPLSHTPPPPSPPFSNATRRPLHTRPLS